MSNNQKRTEKNTIITIVVMIALIIIGSIAYKTLTEPKSTRNDEEFETGTLVDGSYTAEATEASNGFTGIVTMEVSSGNVSSLTYDAISEQGDSKSHLASIGEYVMTEDGLTWEEQAKLLADHVIENQSINTITMDEDGKTDAVSGVSIDVSEFIILTQECLEKAVKGETN